MLTNKKYIAVVCHDAGAANIIISWLNPYKLKNYKILMEGPGKKLFREKYKKISLIKSIDDVLDGVEALIVGTGYQSDLEFNAIKKAKKKKIKTIAILDHWVNYKSRFVRKNKKILPDEIWTTDKFALQLAKKYFPKIKIRLKLNKYINEQIKFISQFKPNKKIHKLLYLLEPINNSWNRNSLGEFQALDFFISKLNILNLPKNFMIVLRLHPSEKKNKYNKWITMQKNEYKISIDNNQHLYKSIGNANSIFGCQTLALVISVKAGKETFCTLPPWAPDSKIPYKKIKLLKNLN